jgi:hypothetical protein
MTGRNRKKMIKKQWLTETANPKSILRQCSSISTRINETAGTSSKSHLERLDIMDTPDRTEGMRVIHGKDVDQ